MTSIGIKLNDSQLSTLIKKLDPNNKGGIAYESPAQMETTPIVSNPHESYETAGWFRKRSTPLNENATFKSDIFHASPAKERRTGTRSDPAKQYVFL